MKVIYNLIVISLAVKYLPVNYGYLDLKQLFVICTCLRILMLIIPDNYQGVIDLIFTIYLLSLFYPEELYNLIEFPKPVLEINSAISPAEYLETYKKNEPELGKILVGSTILFMFVYILMK